MGRACSTNVGKEECIKLLMRKLEGKKPLERPRRKWVNHFKIDLR
jgi:hypothetical protein